MNSSLPHDILEGTADLVAAIDPQFRLIACNRAYRDSSARLLGATVAIGTDLLAALAHRPEDQSRARELWTRALRGERYSLPIDIQGPEGTRYFEAVFYPLEENGKPIGAAHIVREVTAQRQIEEALRNGEQRLQMAQRAARIGTWDWDIIQDRCVWSEHMGLLFGFPSGTTLGSLGAFLNYVMPEDRPLLEQSLERVIESGTDYDVEFRIVRDDGTVRWLSAKGEAFRNAQGRAVRLIGVAIDVTERRSMDDELRRASQELRRSNEDLDQFARVVSHDLKAPLRTIQQLIDLMHLRKGDVEENEELLGLVRQIAQRASLLVDDMLRFARFAAVDFVPAIPIESGPILNLCLNQLRALIIDSGATVTIGDDLPAVLVDATHLLQLFQNLVSNAIQYRREGVPPEIHVSAEQQGDWVRLAVRDNGEGIAPEYWDRVFEAFKRLHGDEIPGSGVGLAICKRIVERYGGRIWLESQSGLGSTFYFLLPAGRD